MKRMFTENIGIKLTTIDDVSEYLSVPFPVVTCKLDLVTRKAYIGRMEMVLKGNTVIPCGWRGKIVLLQGISRRITLTDTIVLPMIVPGVMTPIVPGVADIPYDIINAIKLGDEWQVEFYIVDPYGDEMLLLRANAAIILPDETIPERKEEKDDEQHVEHDKKGEEPEDSNAKQRVLLEDLEKIRKGVKRLNQQAQCYGKSHKISAWQGQRRILENRVEELIEAFEAVNRLWAPERYREVELKIERYSEEIDRLEEKLRLLKG